MDESPLPSVVVKKSPLVNDDGAITGHEEERGVGRTDSGCVSGYSSVSEVHISLKVGRFRDVPL